jgi:hypothetical protein
MLDQALSPVGLIAFVSASPGHRPAGKIIQLTPYPLVLLLDTFDIPSVDSTRYYLANFVGFLVFNSLASAIDGQRRERLERKQSGKLQSNPSPESKRWILLHLTWPLTIYSPS